VFSRVCIATSLVLFALSGGSVVSAADPLARCATPTISNQSRAVIPAAVLSAPSPASVERCWLKPGLVATYRNNVGGESVQTFVGYPEKSEAMCETLVPPCQEWIDNASGITSFSDGELNPLTVRYEIRKARPYPVYFVKKLFRWPLTIGDAWEADFTGPDGYHLHRRVKVVGWEDVRVAAGQFRAIRIEVRDTELRFERNDTVYYDPSLGLTVKSTSDSYTVRTFELVSVKWVDSLAVTRKIPGDQPARRRDTLRGIQ